MTAGKYMFCLCILFIIFGTIGLVRNIIANRKENRKRNQYKQAIQESSNSSVK